MGVVDKAKHKGWEGGAGLSSRLPRAKSRQKGSGGKSKVEREARAVSERRESLAPLGALSCLFSMVVTWGRGQGMVRDGSREINREQILKQFILPRAETERCNLAH